MVSVVSLKQNHIFFCFNFYFSFFFSKTQRRTLVQDNQLSRYATHASGYSAVIRIIHCFENMRIHNQIWTAGRITLYYLVFGRKRLHKLLRNGCSLNNRSHSRIELSRYRWLTFRIVKSISVIVQRTGP